MATIVPELPTEPPESFGSDLVGMGSFLIDPAGAAKYVFRKWFWLGPLIVVGAISLVTYYLTLPMIQHVLEITPPPANTPPEQYQKGMEIGMMMQRIIAFLMPVWLAAIWAVSGLILFAMCSALSVNAKFLWLFNLLAGCSLISLLGGLAGFAILKLKGEVSTMAELRPALGLDIFMPEGSNKYAVALLGYFSVFEIWWIVMMVLIFSNAFRVSKGKAFAIILPLIILSILFRVVGAAFQR
ncbi:MAG TPA: YIP1 family protein [Bryobacteraceae bacterium]|nr:YIP1 family protein [Bryobacteraceae bacterium]